MKNRRLSNLRDRQNSAGYAAQTADAPDINREETFEMAQGVAGYAGPEIDETTRVYRKVTWRLIPFLFACYVAAYLDRVNVGFARAFSVISGSRKMLYLLVWSHCLHASRHPPRSKML